MSRILTLMAIEQIKHEGARLARDPNEVFDNESQDILEVFPDLK